MAINFPDTPSTGDTHTVGSVTWEWDGATWKSQGTQEVLSATSPLAYDGDTKNLTVDLSSYYTSAQADTAISTAVSNLVDSAPATLDTLNELAAALGDDANFATTVTNSLANKTDKLQPISAKTANYAVQPSDNQSLITGNGTFTFDVAFGGWSGGERIDFINIGTGVLSFVGNDNVTISSKDGALTLDTQYAAASLIFTSSTQAYLVGSIA